MVLGKNDRERDAVSVRQSRFQNIPSSVVSVVSFPVDNALAGRSEGDVGGNHGRSLGWLRAWGCLHWIGDAFGFPSNASVSIVCFGWERLLPNLCVGWIASHAVSRRNRHEHLRFERISFLPVHDSVPFFDLSSHPIEQRRESKRGDLLDYPGRGLEWCCLSD